VRLALSEETRLHADETRWPEEAIRRYMWVLIGMTLQIGLYCIDRRTKAAFQRLLPTFKGVGHSDRYAVYKLFGDLWQVCWAHLTRDFARLELRDDESKRIGKECLEVEEGVFEHWWNFKNKLIDRAALKAVVKPLQERLLKVLQDGKNCKNTKTAGFCNNLLELWPNLWLFIELEGVEPTNNEAERAGRKAVLLRKKSYGTDSLRGSRFVERMLTVIETCRRQGRNALEFVTRVIEAGLKKLEPPSLVPKKVLKIPIPV
jgi:transposase